MRRIELPYAKSLANRVMLLRALRGEALPSPDPLWNDDMHAMLRVLTAPAGPDGVRRADAGPAGTAYRFGMAYWAAQPGSDILLCGDERMRERPIAPLVEALRGLGATLESVAEGWRIQGVAWPSGGVAVDARESSQFASALVLVASVAAPDLRATTPWGVSSEPYFAMSHTLAARTELPWPPERDWSAALVFCAAVGLTGRPVLLPGLEFKSVQGDSACAQWGGELGFTVTETPEGITVEHTAPATGSWVVDFGAQPDLAMPAIVAAALLGRSGTASGLHTLNAKESPRLDATADWLGLLGCSVTKGADWINWEVSHSVDQSNELELDCRGDHRMAFCAALISLKRPVRILGSDSVSKSFPDFWEQFGALAG